MIYIFNFGFVYGFGRVGWSVESVKNVLMVGVAVRVSRGCLYQSIPDNRKGGESCRMTCCALMKLRSPLVAEKAVYSACSGNGDRLLEKRVLVREDREAFCHLKKDVEDWRITGGLVMRVVEDGKEYRRVAATRAFGEANKRLRTGSVLCDRLGRCTGKNGIQSMSGNSKMTPLDLIDSQAELPLV